MTGEIASGLFALGGATVGGVASWAAAYAQARSQRQLAGAEHRRDLLEVRREVYVDFFARAEATASIIREIHAFATPAEVVDEVRTRYRGAWDSFVLSTAAVRVMGPDDVAACARDLRVALANLGNQVEAWLDGGRWHQPTFDQHDAERQECASRFLSRARDALES